MGRHHSAWTQKTANRPAPRPTVRRFPAPGRPDAEALLRDLAFVFRATQQVRTAITGRDAR